MGIICLTPENQFKPWILFEAGALSKKASAHVCTYLYGLEPSEVPRPLGQFQHTRAQESDTKILMEAINSRLGDRRLEAARLDESFSVWWPKLEEMLQKIPDRPEDEELPKERSESDVLNEILALVRAQHTTTTRHRKTLRPTPDLSEWDRISSSELLAAVLDDINSGRRTMVLAPGAIRAIEHDGFIGRDSKGRHFVSAKGVAFLNGYRESQQFIVEPDEEYPGTGTG